MARTRRVAVGTGLSLGAAFGMCATADAANFVVTDTGDTGPGTLRAAIDAAEANNNGPAVDQITFQSGLTGTIALDSTLPDVLEPLDITGPGPQSMTISGQDNVQIFDLVGTVTISGLTLSHGNSAGSTGGAILSNGALTVRNSTLSGNVAVLGGAINGDGGSVTIERSTLSGNSSGNGSAVRAYTSSLAIRDSTIASNFGGAAVAFDEAGSIVIQQSTIAGNASAGIDGDDTAGISLVSTIVADNNGGNSDIVASGSPTPVFNLAFSLLENPSGAPITQSGESILGDPQLSPLAFNGGSTQTMLPSPTSPTTDQGLGTGTDQRGITRPFDFGYVPNPPGGNGADIGAVEREVLAVKGPPPTNHKKKKCKKKAKKRSAAAAKRKCKKKK